VFPYYCLFLRGAFPQQVADHHKPGADAYAHLQTRARLGLKPRYRFDQG
jgi:hypothetical protein